MKNIFVFGRFNPPHKGHRKLFDYGMNKAIKESAKFSVAIPLQSEYPLTISEKLKLFHNEGFKRVSITYNICAFLKGYRADFDEVEWICGEDRYKDYKRIMDNYNNVDFHYTSYNVNSFERDDMSSTKLKEYIMNGDFNNFRDNFFSSNYAEEYYEILRERMINEQPV